jgi:hypothetical protein
MTEAEYDDALGDLAKGVLKRLDTCPLHLGSSPRQHYKTASIIIPISSILTEDDLVNAIHEVLQGLRLDLTERVAA